LGGVLLGTRIARPSEGEGAARKDGSDRDAFSFGFATFARRGVKGARGGGVWSAARAERRAPPLVGLVGCAQGFREQGTRIARPSEDVVMGSGWARMGSALVCEGERSPARPFMALKSLVRAWYCCLFGRVSFSSLLLGVPQFPSRGEGRRGRFRRVGGG